MRQVVATVEKIVDHDASLLILGESGSGKNFLAEAVHSCSRRRDEPFVHIDCASVPAELFESELFGHERGTFTDAQNRKPGRLELAGRGTLYLDEISSLAPSLQAKLLRAIEERRFTRLGGSSLLPFEARIVSSSSAMPDDLIASGALRSDLYYRLNVVTVRLPALRERQEDIAALARKFLARSGARARRFDEAAKRLMSDYSWPGNLREMRNAIARAALLEEGEQISATSLGLGDASGLVAAAARGEWTLDELEARYIAAVLERTGANYSRAAAVLGIHRKTLLEKRRKYGL